MQREPDGLSKGQRHGAQHGTPASRVHIFLVEVCAVINQSTPAPFFCETMEDASIELRYDESRCEILQPDLTDVEAGVNFILSSVQDCIMGESTEQWPLIRDEDGQQEVGLPSTSLSEQALDLSFTSTNGASMSLGKVSLEKSGLALRPPA